MHECSSSILSIASNSGFILVRSSTDDEHVQTLAFRQYREEKATLDLKNCRWFLELPLEAFPQPTEEPHDEFLRDAAGVGFGRRGSGGGHGVLTSDNRDARILCEGSLGSSGDGIGLRRIEVQLRSRGRLDGNVPRFS